MSIAVCLAALSHFDEMLASNFGWSRRPPLSAATADEGRQVAPCEVGDDQGYLMECQVRHCSVQRFSTGMIHHTTSNRDIEYSFQVMRPQCSLH
jgi:hypothetical protein